MSCTQRFLDRARKIHGDKYDYSQVDYINNRTKVKIICPQHGPFYQTPQNHYKNGFGCAKCGTIRGYERMRKEFLEFYKWFKKRYPQHDLKQPKTYSENFKFTFICSLHGEFKSTPKIIRKNWVCPQCTNQKIPPHYLNRLEISYPNFDYSKSVYTSRDNNIIVNCKEHGPFTVNFKRHLDGLIGCKFCKEKGFKPNIVKSNKSEVQELERRKKFNELFKGTLEYLEFKDGFITYKCPKHGIKTHSWINVKKGKGCKQCADERFRQQYKLPKEEILQRFYEMHGEYYDYSKMKNSAIRDKIIITCPEHGDFEQFIGNHFRGHGCNKCQISNVHKILNQFLDELGFKYDINNREIIKPQELDIYIEELKLGIEINGLYWHSFGRLEDLNKNRHVLKMQKCIGSGLKLLQFTDYEILNKQEIVLSIIKNHLKLNNKIYARKLEVKEFVASEFNDFFERYHLKGRGRGGVGFGLADGFEIYSMMSFLDNKIDRFATRFGYNIIGGASKLFKSFIRKYNPSEIITYADARYSDGKVYELLGFKRIGLTRPGYCYIKGQKIYSRQMFQKKKIQKLFQNGELRFFDPDLTELDNMFSNGFRVLYDCGNWKFINTLTV